MGVRRRDERSAETDEEMRFKIAKDGSGQNRLAGEITVVHLPDAPWRQLCRRNVVSGCRLATQPGVGGWVCLIYILRARS